MLILVSFFIPEISGGTYLESLTELHALVCMTYVLTGVWNLNIYIYFIFIFLMGKVMCSQLSKDYYLQFELVIVCAKSTCRLPIHQRSGVTGKHACVRE